MTYRREISPLCESSTHKIDTKTTKLTRRAYNLCKWPFRIYANLMGLAHPKRCVLYQDLISTFQRSFVGCCAFCIKTKIIFNKHVGKKIHYYSTSFPVFSMRSLPICQNHQLVDGGLGVFFSGVYSMTFNYLIL